METRPGRERSGPWSENCTRGLPRIGNHQSAERGAIARVAARSGWKFAAGYRVRRTGRLRPGLLQASALVKDGFAIRSPGRSGDETERPEAASGGLKRKGGDRPSRRAKLCRAFAANGGLAWLAALRLRPSGGSGSEQGRELLGVCPGSRGWLQSKAMQRRKRPEVGRWSWAPSEDQWEKGGDRPSLDEVRRALLLWSR